MPPIGSARYNLDMATLFSNRIHHRLLLPVWFIGVAGVLVAFLIFVGWDVGLQASKSDVLPQYVDSQICQPCHADLYDSYQQVAMGRSFYHPSVDDVIEDYRTHNHFYHVASDRHYQMIQRGNKFFQRRYQLDSKGQQRNVFEQEVTYIIGSGNHARTYLNLSPKGVLRQLPVSWYSQEQRWAMSPGYDMPDHDDFSRRVNHACMFCHNAYPSFPQTTDRFGLKSLFPQELPLGIDCQRCHGPGERHVKLASSSQAEMHDIRNAIVNPSRLSPEREMDVCMQCHLEVATASPRFERFGRAVYSFRPGEPLEDYIVHFDLVDPVSQTTSQRFEVDSSAYRLLQSSCFIESQSEMTCTTCHDPHHAPRGEEAVKHFRTRCLTCHPQVSETIHPEPSQSDCVSCHMHKRRTEDAVHVVMTDHLIQRYPPQRDLLAPLQEDHSQKLDGVVLHNPAGVDASEQDLYLGLGQIQSEANLSQGLDRLKMALIKWTSRTSEPYIRLALTQKKSGDWDQAQINLRRALEIDPTLAMTYFNLGEVLRKQGKLEEAGENYRQALKINGEYAEAHNALGLLLQQTQQRDLAMKHFQQAQRSNPFLAESYANLGTIYLQQGKIDEASKQLQEALKIDPANAETYRSLGVAHVRRGRYREGIEVFQYAIGLNQNYPEVYYHLGLAHSELGQQQEAIKAFQQAVHVKVDYAEAYSSLGVVYGQAGRFQEAVDVLKEAIRLQPDFSEAHSNLALAYGQLGQWQQAVQSWSQTVRVDQDNFKAYLNLGLAYGQMGRFQEAISAFQKSIQIKSDFAEAYSNLGAAYGQLGRQEEAIEAFEETVRIKPDFLQAHLNLGASYARLGQLSKAIEAFQGAVSLKPDLVELHKFIGEAQAKLGRIPEAIKALKEVVRLRPQDTEAHFHLAVAYLEIGEKARALEQHQLLSLLDEAKAKQLMDRIDQYGSSVAP